jgi:hypothetical protein
VSLFYIDESFRIYSKVNLLLVIAENFTLTFLQHV